MATRGRKPKSDDEDLPWMKFWIGDWLRSPISSCSAEAQVLWIRLMMIAHNGQPYGTLRIKGVRITDAHLANRCCLTPKRYAELIEEIESVDVPKRDEEDCYIWPQMQRDHAELLLYRKNKRDQRAKEAARKAAGQ